MVGRRPSHLQQLHAPAGIRGCGAHDVKELLHADVVRAGAGDQRAAPAELRSIFSARRLSSL